MQKFKIAIPASLTFGNLLSGFFAIIFAFKGELMISTLFIFLSAVFDTFDGMIARKLNIPSNFGVQLDSLADLGGFGFPAAIITYKFLFDSNEIYGFILGPLFLICGAYRLARFNAELTEFEKKSFSGLPIPFAALTLVAYINMVNPAVNKSELFIYHAVIAAIISLMMVSRITYPAIPKLSATGIKEKPLFFVFMIAGILLTFSYGFTAMFLIFASVILFGIVTTIFAGKRPESSPKH